MNLSLSEGQKKLVGITLSAICASILLVLLYTLCLLAQRFFQTFSMVLWPVIISLILSLILKPLVEWVEDKIRLSRIQAIIFLYALVVSTLLALAAFLIPFMITQGLQFVKTIPELVKNGIIVIQQHVPALAAWIEPYLNQINWEQISDPTLEATKGAVMTTVPLFQHAGASFFKVLSWISMAAIIPIYLFYFLETKKNLIAELKNHVPFSNESFRNDSVFLVEEFLRLMVVFFRGQFVIGAIMGILLASGFSIAGLEFGFIIGILIGLLNIIPYLGTIIGLSIALPIAYFQPEGGFALVGICMGIFILVQIIEGYLLTPKIMGKQTGLHPFILIFAILFWGTALDGILGMILAIPLTAFLITAWALIKRKYLSHISVFH